MYFRQHSHQTFCHHVSVVRELDLFKQNHQSRLKQCSNILCCIKLQGSVLSLAYDYLELVVNLYVWTTIEYIFIRTYSGVHKCWSNHLSMIFIVRIFFWILKFWIENWWIEIWWLCEWKQPTVRAACIFFTPFSLRLVL